MELTCFQYDGIEHIKARDAVRTSDRRCFVRRIAPASFPWASGGAVPFCCPAPARLRAAAIAQDAMRAAEACSTEDCAVKMKLVAPPLYVLTTQTLEKAKGIEVGGWAGGRAGGQVLLLFFSPLGSHPTLLLVSGSPLPLTAGVPGGRLQVLTSACEACQKSIEASKGKLTVKEAARAVSAADDRLLMEKVGSGGREWQRWFFVGGARFFWGGWGGAQGGRQSSSRPAGCLDAPRGGLLRHHPFTHTVAPPGAACTVLMPSPDDASRHTYAPPPSAAYLPPLLTQSHTALARCALPQMEALEAANREVDGDLDSSEEEEEGMGDVNLDAPVMEV